MGWIHFPVNKVIIREAALRPLHPHSPRQPHFLSMCDDASPSARCDQEPSIDNPGPPLTNCHQPDTTQTLADDHRPLIVC